MNKDFYMIQQYDTVFGNLVNSTVSYLTEEEAQNRSKLLAFSRHDISVVSRKLTPMEAVEYFTTLLCKWTIFDLEEAIESDDLFGTVELIIDNLMKFRVLDYIG